MGCGPSSIAAEPASVEVQSGGEHPIEDESGPEEHGDHGTALRDRLQRERDEKLPQRNGTAHPFHLHERA